MVCHYTTHFYFNKEVINAIAYLSSIDATLKKYISSLKNKNLDIDELDTYITVKQHTYNIESLIKDLVAKINFYYTVLKDVSRNDISLFMILSNVKERIDKFNFYRLKDEIGLLYVDLKDINCKLDKESDKNKFLYKTGNYVCEEDIKDVMSFSDRCSNLLQLIKLVILQINTFLSTCFTRKGNSKVSDSLMSKERDVLESTFYTLYFSSKPL